MGESQHLPGKSEEYPVSRLRFKPNTSQIRFWSIIAMPARPVFVIFMFNIDLNKSLTVKPESLS